MIGGSSKDDLINQLKLDNPNFGLFRNEVLIHIGEQSGKYIISLINQFDNKSIMTPAKFIFLQQILGKAQFREGDTPLFDAAKKLKDCDYFEKNYRPDLIQYITPDTFKDFSIECLLRNDTFREKIAPNILEKAPEKKISEIKRYIDSLVKQGKLSPTFFSHEQIKSLLNNKNANNSLKEELRKMLSQNNVTVNNVLVNNALKGSKDTALIKNFNDDVNNTLRQIDTHLKNLDLLDTETFDFNKIGDGSLKIGDQSISIECMLHYLSGNDKFLSDAKNQCSETIKKFLSDAKNQCSETIKKYLSSDGNIELRNLIKLPTNNAFLADGEFYKNLYSHIIATVDYISENNVLNKIDSKTKSALLSNLNAFIKQAIEYLGSYMNNYKVIDENLITSSYSLLYLLNSLTLHHANTGKGIAELQTLYAKVAKTITANIELYNQINLQKQHSADFPAENVTVQIETLINKLQTRLQTLEGQSIKLREQVDAIKANSMNLEKYANETVKTLVKNIQTK